MNKILKLFFLGLSLISISVPSYTRENKIIDDIEFENISLPKNEKEKKEIRISPYAKVKYSDNTEKKYKLEYKDVIRSKDKIGNNIVGLLYNQKREPLYDKNNSFLIDNDTDGLSILKDRNDFYLLTHFETYPGSIYYGKLKKINNDYKLQYFKNIDFSQVGGTMLNCASFTTSWNTHLSAEEDYFFDSVRFDTKTKSISDIHVEDCNKSNNNENEFCNVVDRIQNKYLTNKNDFSNYNYGYILEVGIKNDKNFIKNNLKHYVMGKGTPEIAMVMPDNKTVYITDDGDFRGLYLFIADKERDLSKGTLYIAKWEQISSENNGKANLKWIKLAHSSDSEIKKIIDKKINFSDIFELGNKEDIGKNGFKEIKAGDINPIVIRIRDGKNGSTISKKFKDYNELIKAASFLETRRYGAYLGGTTEFQKEEGITYDKDKNLIYLAMSSISKGMEDNSSGLENEEQNHIRLPKNICGTIYKIKLDNNYKGTFIEELISGKVIDKNNPEAKENYCDTNSIANPDNIRYIGKNILMIAEDTSTHSVPYVWAYNTKSKKLFRVMTGPVGSEFSGMFMSLDDKRNNNIFLTIQHPFSNLSINAFGEKINYNIINEANEEDKRSHIGYIYGLPSFESK